MQRKKLPKSVKEIWENNPVQDYENNKHISYSQITLYDTCPRQWEAIHLTGEVKILPSIHTTFGTAIHTTLQQWLEVLYHFKVKDANEMDLDQVLYENMVKAYLKDKEKNNNTAFTTQDKIKEFYDQGCKILNYIKKRRSTYFSTRSTYLAGIETLLYVELRPGVYFKGKVDLLFYNEQVDKWIIMDIKTSTKGWNKYQKADDSKKAQLLLYKHFLSQQFKIPLSKIEVMYFIVKRTVPEEEEVEFASMRRRVQEFKPADGKIKTGQALTMLNTFIDNVVDSEGNYRKRTFNTTPSRSACKFCELAKNRVCSDAIL